VVCQVVFPSERVEHEFEKFLGKIPSNDRTAIVEALRSLAQHPRPPGKSYEKLKGGVTVFRYTARHRLRVGRYRILYDLDDARKKVILLKVDKRDEQPYG
jgi:mRNA-degrading endonuclease RelE of RelBE toxin-antitoxin system